MKKQIPVPLWLVTLSASLHLVLAGLIVVLVVTAVSMPVVVPATPVPPTATALPPTATSLPPTATIVPSTATPAPPTPTRLPVATAVPCASGGVAGVDCPLNVDGLAVTVANLERASVITVTTETGEMPYVPKDEVNDVFLTVHLVMPVGTMKDDLNVWFEDGGMHAPRIIDEAGNIFDYAFAFVEDDSADGFGVAIVFVVARDAKGLTLVIQGEARVDLSFVTDTTVEVVETPAPKPTSLFSNP